WSTSEIASALPEGGTLFALDVDADTNAVAQRYAEEAGVAARIDFRLGPAIEPLATLDGPFDFVFIDADKGGYVDYYEAVLPKLADGGLIVADNTLFETVDAFNRHVRDDPRTEQVLLTVREGITLIRK